MSADGLDRREFIAVTGGAIASLALGSCASLMTAIVRPEDGIVRLPLRNYPTLSGPGGWLKILPEGAANPLYVLAHESGEYVVLSSICTHLACTVNVEGATLVCPCHGSIYDRGGKVLKGPAERPLARVRSTLDEDGVLIIDLGDAG